MKKQTNPIAVLGIFGTMAVYIYKVEDDRALVGWSDEKSTHWVDLEYGYEEDGSDTGFYFSNQFWSIGDFLRTNI